ncbi:MAG: hypothetical protein KAS07_04195, partial [Candidatus Pacebacteria bacterium]|nr:hypothetical protein [Candidatus Paceibacterota bacterium]
VCAGDSYVEEPDYSAFYRVGDSGVYTMQLTNLDTGHELTDHFEVRSSVAFVVERFGPTRIYPPATYEMKIKITAKQDFDGEIYEYVPDTFEIKDVLQEIISSTASSGVAFIDYRGISPALEEDTTQLLWLSTMNNNDSATITYIFDAPDVSPEFYLLGPMEFYE